MARLVLAAILVFLLVAVPGGANAQSGAPGLEVEYEVDPSMVSSVSDELTVAITVSGAGGRAGDLPLEIRESLPRRPLEVVLVLDRSGSMEIDDYRPTRLEAAKAAASTFLKQIQPGDSAALVSFNDVVSWDVPLTEDRSLTLESLRQLWPDGGTAVGEGLYTAIDVLQGGATESVKAIVLLSDGASNEGRDPRLAASAARDAGIPVFTVGIGTSGDDFDEPALRHITEVTGGEYLYAPDEEELRRVYELMGGKVINVAGVNAALEIEATGLFLLERYTTENLDSDRGGLLVYRWEQIPVGEENTVRLQFRPMATPLGGSAAVVNSIRLTYQSLGSDRVRTVTAGPVEVEFESNLERGPLGIDRISFDRTRDAYPDSTVYFQNDDIRADIHLDRRPREEVVSRAWAQHVKSSSDVSHEFSDDDVISHRVEHPGYVGRYTLTGTVGQDPEPVYDAREEELFVVFDPPREFQNFAQATKIYGDNNWFKGKFTRITQLHPRDPLILEAMADLLYEGDPAWDLSDPKSVAMALALNLPMHKVKFVTPEKLSQTFENDYPNDLEILKAGKGDCTDMAAIYASMVRSLNIPVRFVKLTYNQHQFAHNGSKVNEFGHAFVEVYVDGEWVHSDSTIFAFDEFDSYLEDSVTDLSFEVEYRPGDVEYDRTTALKYSVGLLSPPTESVVEFDLDEVDQVSIALVFTNRAAKESRVGLWDTGEPRARDVRIRVLEDAGLDIARLRLDNDSVLEPGETDFAEMKMRVPDHVADDIPPGGERILKVHLELSYDDGAGGTLSKNYIYEIRLNRTLN